MDALRISLIILGVLLVVGIYLADRMRERKVREAQKSAVEPPLVDQLGDFHVSEDDIPPEAWLGMTFSAQRHDVIDEKQLQSFRDVDKEDSVDDAVQQPEVSSQEQQDTNQSEPDKGSVIILTLVADKGKRIRGPLLLRALKDAGLFFGDMDIFHYVEREGSVPLFSVANILEPGRFVLSEMAEFSTPGIALFMSLPTTLPGDEALRIMLHKARELGAQLNATLCDGQRQPLSDEMLVWLKKKAGQ